MQSRVWVPVWRIGQSTTTFVLMSAAVGVIILCARTAEPRTSARLLEENPKVRPAAFVAEEVFLPRSLLDKSKDETLQEILRDRHATQLDAYLDANGLRDAWFLVRYKGIESDGSTWKGAETNFECKRYHLHSSRIGEIENRLNNLDVLTKVLAMTAGNEPGAIVSVDQAKDTTVSIIRFDAAKLIPIPDEATTLKHIFRNDIDAWRDLARRQRR